MRWAYLKSSHEQTLEQLFPPAAQLVAPAEPRLRVLLMAFVNRSGSNYLGELLLSTGRIGGFEESLNSHSLNFLAPRYHSASFRDYLVRLRAEQTRDGALAWGLKAAWQQLAMLMRTGAIPNLLRPGIVRIRRRDVFAQAVSYYIATETEDWRSDVPAKKARAEVRYDGQKILGCLDHILDSNYRLDQVLLLSGLPYQVVWYEDLLKEPIAITAQLCEDLLGERLQPRPDLVRTRVQRDDLDETFKARFLEELGGLQWEGRAREA